MSDPSETVLEAADETREQLSATVVMTLAICQDDAYCGVSVAPHQDTLEAHVKLLQALEGAIERTRGYLITYGGLS